MPRLSIIYHFFPHYRRGVIEEIRNKWPDAEFIASSREDSQRLGIKSYIPGSGFHGISLRKLPAGKYYLKGFGRYFITCDTDHAIFLGDMNCLSVWFYGIFYRLRGRKVYFWAHGWLNAAESGASATLRKWFFRIPNKILVYGRRARKLAVDRGFHPSNVHVIYNSLDYSAQIAVRRGLEQSDNNRNDFMCSLGLTNEAGYILCVARLTKVKKFDQVVRACAEIPSPQRPLVIFIGSGSEEADLKQLAGELGVAARFMGPCYDETILANHIMNALAVVSPGNVGLTAMHALAYGTPVVTHGNEDHQMPEAEAIIDGVTGFRFEMNSVSSLAAAITRAASLSPVERRRMQRSCIRMIEVFFNPKKQLRKLEAAVNGDPETESVTDRIEKWEIDCNDPFYENEG